NCAIEDDEASAETAENDEKPEAELNGCKSKNPVSTLKAKPNASGHEITILPSGKVVFAL
ncbi:hypothetical protein PV326_010333, partial [Microctonus aethiopoides]